jgi:hypothetical protein
VKYTENLIVLVKIGRTDLHATFNGLSAALGTGIAFKPEFYVVGIDDPDEEPAYLFLKTPLTVELRDQVNSFAEQVEFEEGDVIFNYVSDRFDRTKFDEHLAQYNLRLPVPAEED